MAGNNEIYIPTGGYRIIICARLGRDCSDGGREETQKESISFQKHRSRLKSERGTKEKRPSNEKEWRSVYIYYIYIHRGAYAAVYTHVIGVVLLMKMKRERKKSTTI